MEVAGGVHKVEGLRLANAYVVTIQDGLLLVDSGMPGNAKRILAFIERLGREPRELRYIVLTHCDIDHAGSAAALKSRTGARVAIHALDAPVLAGRQRPQKGGWAMVAINWLLRLRAEAADSYRGPAMHAGRGQ